MTLAKTDKKGNGDSLPIIGLTGGIGAGKSVVSRVLRTMGYYVYDCDSEAKRIMQSSPEVKESLTTWFGEECYFPDGTLNRQYLASFLFATNGVLHRGKVNILVHRLVREDVERRSREVCGNSTPVFVESAILYTSQLYRFCRNIWLVDAPEDLRFERALKRGGIDERSIRERMKAQQYEFDRLPGEKVEVIDNSGEVSIILQIRELLNFR
ncbi:MAG: dephospho-CoA kinase [Muribaculaceae bacterium]|nr:dephospho-CoA kinase [Muribaculaceae bacterium]